MVPIIKTMVFWDLYWGPPILGNYQIEVHSPYPSSGLLRIMTPQLGVLIVGI